MFFYIFLLGHNILVAELMAGLYSGCNMCRCIFYLVSVKTVFSNSYCHLRFQVLIVVLIKINVGRDIILEVLHGCVLD